MHNSSKTRGAFRIDFTNQTAAEEAARCLLCHDAPCNKACPMDECPSEFICSARFKNIKNLKDTLKITELFSDDWRCPCGAVCEKFCNRSKLDRAVEIEKLHRYMLQQSKLQSRAKNNLSILFLGVRCENPFFLASSPAASSYDKVARAFEAGWGGAFFKTVGIFAANECSPRFDVLGDKGTPWRGFKNMEQISDKPLEQNLEYMRRLKADFPEKVIVASIMGRNEDEWRYLALMCEQAGVNLIEGNFSCPQMALSGTGSDVGTNPDLVRRYTKAVTETTKLPFIAKMSPNITDITAPAIAAVESGAKGIAAINTVKSITNLDLENMTGMPIIEGKSSISGYSGAAIKPIALRFICELRQSEKLHGAELSGSGGIETWRDAAEFLLLGCRNIQVCTAVMQYGNHIIKDFISGLSHFMDERGFKSIDDFVGLAAANIVPAEKLNRDFQVLPDFNNESCIGCGRCYISCRDAARQALEWNSTERKPILQKDKCAGCHLCRNVCPVKNITLGEIRYKEGLL